MNGLKIKLKSKEVKILKALIGKGTEKARKITRCRILLLCNDNRNKKEIALALSIDPHTITNAARQGGVAESSRRR